MDLRGNIPPFISITNAKVHDVNILDELIAEPGSIYVLVAIMKKKLKFEQSLYTILQILRFALFEKIPISWAFTDDIYRNKIDNGPIQYEFI